MPKLLSILLIIGLLILTGCADTGTYITESQPDNPTLEATHDLTPEPLKMPVRIAWMNLEASSESTVNLQIQVENTGDKVVVGYKIYAQLFDADGQIVRDTFMGGTGEERQTIMRKGIELKKGYKTDRDIKTAIMSVEGVVAFKAAVYECTYEDGNVSELSDGELEWIMYP